MFVSQMLRKNIHGLLIVLWLVVGIMVRLSTNSLELTNSKSNSVVYAPVTIPSVIPLSGTFGLENTQGLYWLSGKEVVFKLVNPLEISVQLETIIINSQSPCGGMPRVKSAVVTNVPSAIITSTSSSFKGTVKMSARSQVEMRVLYHAKRCVISSDPRVFWGAINKISTSWISVR